MTWIGLCAAFYGSHSFPMLNCAVFISHGFKARLGFARSRPAETAPGMPVLTFLCPVFPAVVNLFCLWAEQGLSLPVTALLLLSEQVSNSLLAPFSCSFFAFKNPSRDVWEGGAICLL